MNRMTIMDKRLQIYVPLLDFLSAILGEDAEVVLQDLTKGFDHSLVYIRNNLSNREVGAPATDFVLDIVQSKLYKQTNFLVNYRTKTESGRQLYSSSFFIKDKRDGLLGMICINADKSKEMNLKYMLESTLEILNNSLTPSKEKIHEEENIVENFYATAESLIDDVIFRETQGKDLSKTKLTKVEKVAIVQSLYTKGFFDLKESVSKMAEAFGMSEVSIYKYIQDIKKKES